MQSDDGPSGDGKNHRATSPRADGGASELDQLRAEIERYKRAYLMSTDERFRKAVGDIIAELERRLREKENGF